MSAPSAGALRDKLVLLGICSDANSSFLSGAAEAPPLIRAALHNGSSNLTSETGVCLAANPRFADLGDASFGGEAEAFAAIEAQVAALAGEGGLPLILGGDHAITYPIVHALWHDGTDRWTSCTSTRIRICSTNWTATASRTPARSRGSWRRGRRGDSSRSASAR